MKKGELPSTFVDGRNLLFLSFAACIGKTSWSTSYCNGCM
ncbi:7-cyano-7-deazaguanine synthase [Bacillus pacificus]